LVGTTAHKRIAEAVSFPKVRTSLSIVVLACTSTKHAKAAKPARANLANRRDLIWLMEARDEVLRLGHWVTKRSGPPSVQGGTRIVCAASRFSPMRAINDRELVSCGPRAQLACSVVSSLCGVTSSVALSGAKNYRERKARFGLRIGWVPRGGRGPFKARSIRPSHEFAPSTTRVNAPSFEIAHAKYWVSAST
jgi:hypothetical protein